MLTIFDNKGRKLLTVTGGQDELFCRVICDGNPKLFKKDQTSKEDRTIYTVLDSLEAKITDSKRMYFYKDFVLEFQLS